jgi:NAD(P)-dependent dehydrogenase (short-subunit alcohol dehydrogenase family)
MLGFQPVALLEILFVARCFPRGCRNHRAVYAVADVADPTQVDAIAGTAIREFGRVDTWVSNAVVSMYGRIMDLGVEPQPVPVYAPEVVSEVILHAAQHPLRPERCVRRTRWRTPRR